MDKLSVEERALAWEALWNPSYVGIGIVDKNLSIRSVNPQFCDLLGIQPSDVIGKKILDVTSADYRILVEDNCKLMRDGYMDFYLLQKAYRFSHLPEDIRVMELLSRAPSSAKDFQFFVLRIMRDESKQGSYTKVKKNQSNSDASYLLAVVDFMMIYGKWFATIGTILGAIAVALWGSS